MADFDVTQLSDDDLIAMEAELSAPPPEKMPTNIPDDIIGRMSDDQLAALEHELDPPKLPSIGPANYGNSMVAPGSKQPITGYLTASDVANMPAQDPLVAEYAKAVGPQPKQWWEQFTQPLVDAAQQFGQAGADAQQYYRDKGVQPGQAPPPSVPPPLNPVDIAQAGGMTGLASAADAAVNLMRSTNPLMGMVSQPSNLQKFVEMNPDVQQAGADYPKAYEAAVGAGEMLAPIPGGAGARVQSALAKQVAKETAKEVTKRIAKQVAQDAAVGAAYGGAFENSRQVKGGEQDILQLLAATGVGGLAGGGLGAVIHPGVQGLKLAGQVSKTGYNKAIAKAVKPSAQEAAQSIQSTEAPRQQALKRLAELSGDNEAFAALQEIEQAGGQLPPMPGDLRKRLGPAPEPALEVEAKLAEAKPTNSFEAALDAIRNGTPESIDEVTAAAAKLTAIKNAPKAWKQSKKKALDAAYAEYERKQIYGRLEQQAAEPKQAPPPVTTTRRVSDVQAPIEQPKPVEPVNLDEFMTPPNEERTRYPKAFEPLASETLKGEKTRHTAWDDNVQWDVEQPGSSKQLIEQREVYPQDLNNAELQALLETVEVEAQRATIKPSERKVLQGQVEQLVQEKSRRAEREARGMEPDYRTEDPTPPPEGTKIEPPSAEEPSGDFRYRTPDYLGHEQAIGERNYPASAIGTSKTLEHLRDLKAQLKSGESVDVGEATRRLVQEKTDAKYLEDLVEDYGDKLLKHFAPDQEALNAHGVTIRKTSEKILPRSAEEELAKIRAENADLSKPKSAKKHTETLTSEYTKDHLQEVPMPATTDINSGEAKQAFAQLKALKKKALEADKRYKAIKAETEPLIEQAELAHRKINSNEHLRLEGTAELKHVDLSTGEFTKPVKQMTAVVHHKNETRTYELLEEAQGMYDYIRKALLDAEGKLKTKTKVTAAAASGLLASLQGQAAHAADGVAQVAAQAPDLWANLGSASPYVAAAAVLAKGAPAIARKVLDSKNVVSNVIFKDVVDHVKYLDDALGTDLQRKLWVDNLGQAYRATFGVTFDKQFDRTAGIAALRDKSVTPQQALQGQAGSVFEHMTPAQRKAVVTFHGVQLNIGKQVREQQKLLADAIQQNPDLANDPKIDFAKAALRHLDKAVSPSEARSPEEKLLSELVSNFMEYNFFWNVEHHATNLSDSWIAGGSRVGPINIAHAHKLLDPMLGDKDLKALFKSSNFLASNTADRMHAQVNNQGKKLFADLEDLPSDRINADRVALGSFLQFHGLNKDRIKQTTGIENNVEFVKKMLTDSNFDPNLAAEAWGHMAETTSRTLGMDPYRLNGVMLTMAKNSPALGVFMRQPSRLARLMVNHLAEGNWKGALTLVGMTAAIGGQSAMPDEVRGIWSKVDPAGFYTAAKFLDDYSIGGHLGSQVGPKVTWSFLWPAMASVVPLSENLKKVGESGDAFEKVLKGWADLADKKPGNDKKAQAALIRVGADLTALFGNFKPRVGPIPVRDIAKGARAAGQAVAGEQAYYLPEGAAKPGPQRPVGTISLEKEGIPAYEPLIDQFVPGRPDYLHRASMAAGEAKDRKRHEDVLNTAGKLIGGSPGESLKGYATSQAARKPAYSDWDAEQLKKKPSKRKPLFTPQRPAKAVTKNAKTIIEQISGKRL